MYRVLVILAAGSILAACSGGMNWDAFKPAPMLETLKFESEPPGAEAKTSTGQSCRTPCALAVNRENGLSVTFNLNGFRPESETVQLVSMGDGTSSLQPNPVLVELTPAPPPPKKPPPPKRKPVAKKKPATAPASATTTPAPATGQSAGSPWPTR